MVAPVIVVVIAVIMRSVENWALRSISLAAGARELLAFGETTGGSGH